MPMIAAPVFDTVSIYRVSVSSLFILAILEETERSIVRSPISTTNPPTISGLTCARQYLYQRDDATAWVCLVPRS